MFWLVVYGFRPTGGIYFFMLVLENGRALGYSGKCQGTGRFGLGADTVAKVLPLGQATRLLALWSSLQLVTLKTPRALLRLFFMASLYG